MRKIVLLLTTMRGKRVEFRRRFTSLAGAHTGVSLSRWSLQLLPGELPEVPHQQFMRASPAPCDGVLELAPADTPETIGTCAAVVEELSDLLDRARCDALVCDEVQITSGWGPVFVVMTLRRLPSMDRAAFMSSWFGRHAALGEAVEGVRYRQNHVVDGPTSALGSRLGFRGMPVDGLALSFFEDVAEAHALLSSPAVAHDALADERTFIDHSRSQFGLYRVLIATLT